MKRIIFSILVILLLAGCESAVERQIEEETGGEADVDIGGGKAKVTIETDEGKQTLEVKTQNEDSWCQAGSEWKMSGTEGQAQMNIVGIVEGGKYDGFCHVTYDINAEGSVGNIDMYFNEDGDGYQVIEMNGQKIESEWTG